MKDKLTRYQIRKYLEARRGGRTMLATKTDTTLTHITSVLQGRTTSEPVWQAAEELVRELRAKDNEILRGAV